MIALWKREREHFISAVMVGVICALIGCAGAIVFQNWDVTSKVLGIIFILVITYIAYNEYDKHLLSKERHSK
jgi:CHASE2 domain-containing sensor protein